jgi:hypothetical protein
MVKNQFSKSIQGSKTPLFSFLLRKNGNKIPVGVAVAELLDSSLYFVYYITVETELTV